MSCELWGTTVAGWATDYVILLACVVCGGVALLQRGARKEALFLILMISTGLSFALGGLAHMLLFFVEESGESCGSSFSEDNSEWLYPWLLSMLVAPFSPAALLGMAARGGQFGFAWVIVVTAFLLAMILAIVEVALLVSLALDVSGVLSGFWILGGSAIAIFLCLIDGYRNGFTRAVAYGILSPFMYILSGLTLLFLTGLLPDAFNHNAVCHVFVTFMVIFAFLYRQQPASAKFELAATPASQKSETTAQEQSS